MAVYQVRLVNPALNLDRTISVPDDQYILDMAEEAGIRLPTGCRVGILSPASLTPCLIAHWKLTKNKSCTNRLST